MTQQEVKVAQDAGEDAGVVVEEEEREVTEVTEVIGAIRLGLHTN